MRGAPNLRLTSKFIIHSSYREKCPVFIIKSEEKFNVTGEKESMHWVATQILFTSLILARLLIRDCLTTRL